MMTESDWFDLHQDELENLIYYDLCNKSAYINTMYTVHAIEMAVDIISYVNNTLNGPNTLGWVMFNPKTFVMDTVALGYINVVALTFPAETKLLNNLDNLLKDLVEYCNDHTQVVLSESACKLEWETECEHTWVPMFNINHLVCKHCGIDRE